MHPVERAIGVAILPLYFVVTLLIGWVARRGNTSAKAYLSASRSLPLWVVVAAYLASNCGALEIVGLSAVAAQYGAQAFHFYWIGAIPAMVFLAIWMMPVYRRSGVASVRRDHLAARGDQPVCDGAGARRGGRLAVRVECGMQRSLRSRVRVAGRHSRDDL